MFVISEQGFSVLSGLCLSPAAVPGLSCMAAWALKLNDSAQPTGFFSLLVFTRLQFYFRRHVLSLRIPVWEKLTLAEFPSL